MSTLDVRGTITVSAASLRGVHHGEVLAMTKDADGPGGSGVYYNSMGVPDGLTNEEFDERFRALDPDALKKQLGGDVIRFNGPRRSMMSRMTGVAFDGGKTHMIGGLPMHLYGVFVVPDLSAFSSGEQPAYTEFVSKRTTTWFFDAGEEVYELVSPAGSVYVMQSASLMVDPGNTVDRLVGLGERQSRPEGWAFRARTLEDELVVRADAHEHPAAIVLDEFENNYQRIDN